MIPIYENVEYLSMPKQVQKNRKDITDLKEEDLNLEEDIGTESFRNDVQDENIGDLEEQIISIEEILASGGILVSRRVAATALTTGSGTTVKMIYDETQKESNDETIISYDINNDHILKREGTYTVNAGFNIDNAANQPKTFTLSLISIDTITSAEIIIDSRTGNIPALTTLPVNPSFDYERPAGNDILLVVRQNLEDINVTIAIGATLGVTSQFTISGSGIATKTTNIAPKDTAFEGVLGTEITLEEILKNYKSLLIEIDGSGNTLIKRNGVAKWRIDASGNWQSITSNRIVDIANPVNPQDAVTKAYMNTLISVDGAGKTLINSLGTGYLFLNDDGHVYMAGQERQLKVLKNPTDPQDAVTKIYSDLKLLLTGGTLTGALTIIAPTADLHAATKKYVDDNLVAESEGAAVNGVLTIAVDAYQGHECQKLGKQVSITCIVTGTASTGNTLLTIPAGFRPNEPMVGTVHLIGSTTEYKVTINPIGTIVALEAIAAGDKAVIINYNVI